MAHHRVIRHVGAGLLAVMLGQGTPLLAQAHGTLVGTVVDEATGLELEGATVSVPAAGVDTKSDSMGFFELSALPTGHLAVRVALSGFVTVVEQIEVLPDEIGLFQFRLGRVEAILQGLEVRVRQPDVQGPSVTEIERGDGSVRTALDLLRQQVPGLIVRSRPGAETGIRIRGSNSLMMSVPVLYVDGTLVGEAGSSSAGQVLETIPAENVLRIRILRGPSTEARYGDATGGVILVETR